MPRVIPERRKLEYGKKKSRESRDKAGNHLVQRDGRFNGILFRNCLYREEARNWMKETGFYDDEIQIRKGIRHQVTFNKLTDNKKRQAYINDERIEFYTFNYKNKKKPWVGVLNFARPTGMPYGNEAHHILSCDIFYDDAWTDKLLTVVKECSYDINNEGNIIYLPTDRHDCFYHDLPCHTAGHSKYNDKVKRFTTKVLNKAKKVLDAGCSDKEKYMKELFNMLIKIEDMMYKHVTSIGAGPLGPTRLSSRFKTSRI